MHIHANHTYLYRYICIIVNAYYIYAARKLMLCTCADTYIPTYGHIAVVSW